MREGIHPEKTILPFTPGWDIVGIVDEAGEGASHAMVGKMVAALPIHGGYAQFICLPEYELTPVPTGVDPAEAVSLVLNYVTAYQMMHRLGHASPGQRVLIHGAAGGVGMALLQLGHLAGLEMYGTASRTAHQIVSDLGATPIDYKGADFVKEIHRLTNDGVDVVFDGVGEANVWRSFRTLRPGGRHSLWLHFISAEGPIGRRLALSSSRDITTYVVCGPRFRFTRPTTHTPL